MKLIGKGVQVSSEGHAEFGVIVNGVEDLWHLYNFICEGDVIGTKTVRKIVKETATGSGTSERRVLVLHIVVNSIDFDAGGIMRLSGVNRTESDYVKMNAHHTLEIFKDPPQTVYIFKKEWNTFLEERLKEACDEDSRSDTAAVIMDYGQAQVCLINGTMVVTKVKIEVSIPKKRKMNASSRDDSIGKFFGQIFEAMVSHINLDTVKCILVCSPGTLREEYMTYVNKRLSAADIAPQYKLMQAQRSKLVPILVSSGQRNAINEALNDRVVQQKLSSTKCCQDIAAWTKFEELLSLDPDKVTYGPQYVHEAMTQQAIEILMISDACFRSSEARLRRYYVALGDEVQNYGGTVIIMSTQHTTGEALSKLSGVAAILRQPMPHLEDVDQDIDFLQSEAVEAMVRAQTESDTGMGSTQRTGSTGNFSGSGKNAGGKSGGK